MSNKSFQVGGPVTGEGFFDREEFFEEFERSLIRKRSVLGFALYGLRRTGKSSILKEFQARLESRKNVIAIYIDVSAVHPFSIENFYDRVFEETFLAFQKREKLPRSMRIEEILHGSVSSILDFLRRSEVSVSIKEYLELRIKFSEKKASLDELLKKAFETPEKLSKETGCRAILMLDEFPFFESFGVENSFWALRSVVQDWKESCLIVSGSNISVMKQIASKKTSPFYLLLQIREVKPFDEKNSVKMLSGRFGKIGLKSEKGSLKLAYDLTGGFPFYLQWLGDRISDISSGKIISEKTVRVAFEKILNEAEAVFQIDISSISNGERDVILEIAEGREKVNLIADSIGKSAGVAGKNLERLAEKGFVKKTEKGYEFNDPVLKAWMRYKFSKHIDLK